MSLLRTVVLGVALLTVVFLVVLVAAEVLMR